MSVLIDMDMPVSCKKCPLWEYEEGRCKVTGRQKNKSEPERPKWCPLTESPCE